jgi:large subunit ribosomal protein L3e
MEKLCTVIRVIAHTQIDKLTFTSQKKAHIIEIQVNGGKSIGDKLKFARNLMEKIISVDQVFAKNEMLDTMSITKGKGFRGVIKRWGVRKLPRKTHKGLRKVGCIGSWHPERIRYSVPRAGQTGYHHRVLFNKKIYMLGKNIKTAEGKLAGKTEADITEKGINPMGSFPNYGPVRNDFVMVKGCISGPVKRVVTMRKTLLPQNTRPAKEQVTLKFIDTSSKMGHGRFQTHKEKKKFMGPLKKDLEKKRKKELARMTQDKNKKPKVEEKK